MTAAITRAAAVLGRRPAAATLAPAAASAQSYGYGDRYNQGYSQPYGYNQGYSQGYATRYDRCQTLGQGRTGAGVLIGGGLGAVAGSQIAARGNRTEGSIIGGVLGAIVGAQVGGSSNAQCRSDYRGQTYSQAPTYYSSNDRYDDRAYGTGRYDDRGYRSGGYDDRRGYDTGYQISPDGRYYYDPRRGWTPR